MSTRVKICGITNAEDALKASFYGATAVGFIFHKKSVRYISPSKARTIIEKLPPFVTPVGVFVNLSERAVKDICGFARIRTVQFHGEEDTVYCKRFSEYKIIKAFRIQEFIDIERINKYKVDAYLFDTYQEDVEGGTGKTFNWKLLNEHKFERPIILSGGLNPTNVREVIESVSPFGVDVSSGVEKSPGIKNPRLVHEFFDAANFYSIK